MQFLTVAIQTPTVRSLLYGCAALVLVSTSGGAMADDVPADVVDTPARQAFLSGTTKDCPGCDLRGVNLKRRDLSGADLSGADLHLRRSARRAIGECQSQSRQSAGRQPQ